MLVYILIEEMHCTPELGAYQSYGIRVENEVGKTVAVLSDISTDQAMVTELAERCTRGALAPEQLYDVVLNSI